MSEIPSDQSGYSNLPGEENVGESPYYQQFTEYLGRRVLELEAENAELARDARLNPVSSLYNQRGLQERFDQSIEDNPTVRRAVLAIDLGSFKAVNDELGHHRGDELLRLVGSLFRTTDDEAIVANPHGDEFVIILPLEARENPDLSDEDRISAIVSRIKGLGEVLKLQDPKLQELAFSISVGGVVYEPGETLPEALIRADSKMYIDKRESLPALNVEQQAAIDLLNAAYAELARLGLSKRQSDKYLDF